MSEADHPGGQRYDRWFLLGEKRNEVLTLREVQQYGRDSFGDPDHVSIQVFETVEPGSLADLTARFPWSAVTLYDINAPGQNAGLLLATWGWAPA
jgi:hypothetical protein